MRTCQYKTFMTNPVMKLDYQTAKLKRPKKFGVLTFIETNDVQICNKSNIFFIFITYPNLSVTLHKLFYLSFLLHLAFRIQFLMKFFDKSINK